MRDRRRKGRERGVRMRYMYVEEEEEEKEEEEEEVSSVRKLQTFSSFIQVSTIATTSLTAAVSSCK